MSGCVSGAVCALASDAHQSTEAMPHSTIILFDSDMFCIDIVVTIVIDYILFLPKVGSQDTSTTARFIAWG